MSAPAHTPSPDDHAVLMPGPSGTRHRRSGTPAAASHAPANRPQGPQLAAMGSARRSGWQSQAERGGARIRPSPSMTQSPPPPPTHRPHHDIGGQIIKNGSDGGSALRQGHARKRGEGGLAGRVGVVVVDVCSRRPVTVIAHQAPPTSTSSQPSPDHASVPGHQQQVWAGGGEKRGRGGGVWDPKICVAKMA